MAAPGSPPEQADQGLSHRPVCPAVSGANASCRSLVVTGRDGVTPRATKTYSSGYGAADLRSAYGLGSIPSGYFAWNNETIAIVDAYDNPSAAADLTNYRKTMGLPLCKDGGVACLFSKVNQNGGTTLPRGDSGWGQEIALDLDMASAICPMCQIVLVEGSSASLDALGTAVNTAAGIPGVVAISNSYGTTGEASWVPTYAPYYNHPGIAITVSSGDSGYGISFPDDLATIIAVGGTTLSYDRTTQTRTNETVWSGAGSGCSAYVGRPAFQTNAIVGTVCNNRVSADISAVANPSTGVAVYDSYGSRRGANWYVFGGTSVSAPIIAGVFALANNYSGVANPASLLYAAPSSFNDVVTGSNGSCSSSLLCTGKTGYDGPTGLGTPNGIVGF